MVVVIDTGMANVGSVSNIIRYLGFNSVATNDLTTIRNATKLILPGVGAFDAGMNALNTNGIREVLNEKVLNDKVPVLGICLGMQLMTKGSEEGVQEGLGWFDAQTVRFSNNMMDGEQKLRVPHMGWNRVNVKKKQELFTDVDGICKFYFVHSYYVKASHQEDVMATTMYSNEFVSALHKENIYGVQFHPEKSHKFGMSFIRGFLSI